LKGILRTLIENSRSLAIVGKEIDKYPHSTGIFPGDSECSLY